MNPEQASVRQLGPQEEAFLSSEPLQPNTSSSKRLTTKYLWLSLIVALIPLLGFASLYDSYFSQLVARLTEEQLATRIAATSNEFRVFLRERKFELDALADQFDNPDLFTPDGYKIMSPELESLLRLQVDASSVYGIVFYDKAGQVAWTFPQNQTIPSASSTHLVEFEGAELIGPTPPSVAKPASIVLRQKPFSSDSDDQHINNPLGRIGLIVRFNSITEILRRLDQSSTFRVFIQAGEQNIYDVVGQPVTLTTPPTQYQTLLPGWSLNIIQSPNLLLTSLERMRYWLILMMSCTIAAVLWLYMSISKRLTRQVESLIQSVEKVAQGDLDTPVTVIPGIETNRLTHAIEQMRLQLKTFIRATLKIERQATLGQLAAGLAHDIRNPLTTIRTTVVALSRRESNPENKEMMSVIEEEIDRVNNVIEHLLNYARPRDPHAERIDAKALLASVSTLVGASARNQNVTLSVECEQPLSLWADEGHVRQILMNLVINSLQAMSVRGSHIRLKAAGHENQVELSVTDDGQGMAEEVKNKIMEPFFTTKSAGTGLGLATCSSLVNSNGGTMTINSTEGAGTSVILLFPAAQPLES